MNNRNQQNDIFGRMGKNGLDGDAIRRAADKNDVNALLNSLNDKDKAKLQSILDDPETMKKMLSSEKAQALFRKLTGEKNG